ncbi:MAG: hypothetical protein WBP55_07590 [Solirubrobacterales bacterium]
MPGAKTTTPAVAGPASAGITGALILALITVSFLVVMPMVVLLANPTVVAGGLAEHKQNAETLVYLLSFFGILPFWLWFGPRIADRIQSGPNGAAFPALVASLATLLFLLVAGTRLLEATTSRGGLGTLLAGSILWAVLAGVLLLRASQRSASPAILWLVPHTKWCWFAAAALLPVALLALVRFGHIDLPALVVCAAVAGAVFWGISRFRLPDLSKPWRRFFDVATVLLLLLAVPDMIVVPVERAGTVPGASLATYIIPFHQNLFLGAASQVLAGSALLVDTVSQYGIAPIYVIAGFFTVAPIGHGTLGFLDGFLSAVTFGIGYALLRMAGVRFLLAFAAMAIAVVALVYDLTYPLGGLLQHGALRFGLPMLLIAPVVAGLRWPKFARPAKFIALLVVGISSIWALEAFLYVTFSYLGLSLMLLAWDEPGTRLRAALRRIGEMVAAWVAVQVIFAILTLIFGGALPDWGLYLTYLRDFLAGDVGDLTYDFTPWSRAFFVALIYVSSVVALWTLATRNAAFVNARRPAMVAIAGLTAYGIALFSYYDNRSLDHVVPYISLPALLVATIWLSFLIDARTGVRPVLRRYAVGLAAAAAVLMVAVAWPAAGTRYSDSLLAYAIPGGNTSLSEGFDRLWNMPPVAAGSDEGQRLVEKHMGAQDKAAVVTVPDLDVDILVRSDKANALAITDAKEMSWVSGPHSPEVDAAVDQLEADDLILLDKSAREAFRYAEANPEADAELSELTSTMEAVQRRVLARIASTYRLETVERGKYGLTVYRLEPRG